jgi:hypothetical protein
MTTKKGILVRVSASTDVHKLDDDGNFNLGLAGDDPTISLNAVTTVEGLASDVKTMITNIDTAVLTESDIDTDTLTDIQTKLDNLQIQLGCDVSPGDGTTTWAGTYVGGAADFKAADTALDGAALGIQNRLNTMRGHTGTGFTNQIADVVFADPNATDGTDLGTGGALLTINEIKTAISAQNGTITPTTVRAAMLQYITGQENSFVNAASASFDTLKELKEEVAEEIQRYNVKSGSLESELGTSLGNSSLTAAGAVDFGFAGKPYIAAAATLKAADVALDIAVKARSTKMNNWETHLDLTGDITATGAASLSSVSFAANSGRFTMPRMSAGDAETAFASGNHDGKFVYILGNGSPGSNFEQGDKLYMCEDGVWFASSFKYE